MILRRILSAGAAATRRPTNPKNPLRLYSANPPNRSGPKPPIVTPEQQCRFHPLSFRFHPNTWVELPPPTPKPTPPHTTLPPTQNPTQTQATASSFTMKRKPKWNKKMFHQSLIIYKNPPSKDSFSKRMGLAASLATFGSIVWVFFDHQAKKEREAYEDDRWKKVESRLGFIFEWSLNKLTECEERYFRLLSWITLLADDVEGEVETKGGEVEAGKVDDVEVDKVKGADVEGGGKDMGSGGNVEGGGKDMGSGGNGGEREDVDGSK